MLNDATGFDKIFIATGYTDLRRGIDGLASTIKYQFELDPFQKNILFLFCGKRTDRIKGLVWGRRWFPASLQAIKLLADSVGHARKKKHWKLPPNNITG